MIVVNFSTDKYRIGQERLRDSLYWNKQMSIALYGSYKEIGSPTHQKSNYEFKVHAMRKAMKEDPIVFWCDASIWLVGDIKRIEEAIRRDGYFMEEAGHFCRDWCNQHTLDYFNLTKETNYRMFTSGCFGLDMRQPICQHFFNDWAASAKAGCFNGDWEGEQKHRHDMTVGGIVASRLGMRYQPNGEYIAYTGPGYDKPKENVVFHCQGLV